MMKKASCRYRQLALLFIIRRNTRQARVRAECKRTPLGHALRPQRSS